MLFHISEEADIQRFEPRPSEYTVEPVVWAIDVDRLRNYLVPRDCPRVTYYAGPETMTADLPPQTFECIDECAGYFVSRVPVVPTHVDALDAPISELQRRGVEFRIAPNLWPLRDAVVASSLRFSIIRMRQTLPRSAACTVDLCKALRLRPS